VHSEDTITVAVSFLWKAWQHSESRESSQKKTMSPSSCVKD